MSCTAIIVAAGRSERFGGELPKPFVEVAGKPVLAWTLSRFEQASAVDDVLLVVAEEFMSLATELVDRSGCQKVVKVVSGGSTRQESVRKGIEASPHGAEYVAIHDGARPFVSPGDINTVIATAQSTGAAILATLCTDTLKQVAGSLIERTLPKEGHYLAQTPQVFRRDMILAAHRETTIQNAVDDAVLIETRGIKVAIVEPKYPNPKITYAHDLAMAQGMLGQQG